MFTLYLVSYFYSHICGIPSRLSQNDSTLYTFLTWQHIILCFPMPIDRTQNKCMTAVTIIVLAVMSLQCLVWPILAWFDWSITRCDTDFYTVRYAFYLLYIFAVQQKWTRIDSVTMLVADGFLLSQIASMLWYNELSLALALFCVTPWFLVQNCVIALDILNFEVEPAQKTNFVRLIGTHSALFMVLVFTAMVLFNTGVDAAVQGPCCLGVIAYIPFVLYLVNRIMESS